jgi:hypothetical protein
MDQNDPIFPEAGHVNGTSVVGTTESPGMTEADSPTADQANRGSDSAGLRPGFLSELASAMRATAERERETIAARVAEDAAVHIEKVRSRAAIETEELRRLAEEDVQHIQEWSATEMERIRTEADQKIEDRRASLDEYLHQHDAIIETEIEGVDAAVRGYGATLDGFFAELAQAGDPSAIVARAEALPAPPDLDQVRAQARSSAVAMFAEPEASADGQIEADAGTEAVAEAVVPDDSSSDAIEGFETVAEGDSPEVAEFIAPTTDVDATNGAGEAEAIAEADAIAETEAEAPVSETTSPADSGEAAESTPAAEPVPVMDPAATANPAWPASEPTGESEPVAIAPTIDHTSAAVRLLRSVAPWTAPTHAGSDRQQPD